MKSHEVDYKIFGDDMQLVEVELDPGEEVIAEAGAMMYMEDAIAMDAIFGDGSQEEGGMMGKIFSAGKRVLTGESLFMTAFKNTGNGKKHVSFAGPHPGKIIAIDLDDVQGKLICQRDSFLCAARGTKIGLAFQKRLGVGFFGGEGFILQSLEGDGMAFIHAGGTIVERTLQPGEILRIDTGCIVAFTKEVHYDIQMAGGIKTSIFGGEGLFLATLSGPGKVWLQSLPFNRLANKVLASARGAGGQEQKNPLGGIVGSLFENN